MECTCQPLPHFLLVWQNTQLSLRISLQDVLLVHNHLVSAHGADRCSLSLKIPLHCCLLLWKISGQTCEVLVDFLALVFLLVVQMHFLQQHISVNVINNIHTVLLLTTQWKTWCVSHIIRPFKSHFHPKI